MRVVEWIGHRWEQTTLSRRELANRSGVSEQTLFRIQRRHPDYRLSRSTLLLLAAPLQLGKAAVALLSDRAAGSNELDEKDMQKLEVLAGPVRPEPRGPA